MARFQRCHPIVTLLLLSTGVVGGLVHLASLSNGPTALVGGSASLLVVCLWLFLPRDRFQQSWPLFVATTFLVSFVVALCGPSSQSVGNALCWSVVAAMGIGFVCISTLEESLTPVRDDLVVPVSRMPQSVSIESGASTAPHPHPAIQLHTELDDADEDDIEGELIDGEIDDEDSVQTWSRHLGDNEDRLEGSIVIQLASGQRHGYFHFPFVPFFSCIPDGYCESVSDGDIVVEIDLLHVYGARLNFRRRGRIDEPLESRLNVVFSSKSVNARAA
ncbi:hypothetical protein SH668x_002503 [Planctomicrobium sp. SH668]|uniref:hypothetical protein n=1 Tax=Planctomicrobium sp. SH668 TaxID=3448126 RepID=UPI003F5C6EB3